MGINFDQLQPGPSQVEQAKNLKNSSGKSFLRKPKPRNKTAVQSSLQNAAEAWSDVGTQANQARVSGQGPSMAQTNAEVPGTMEAAGKMYDLARGSQPTYGAGSDNDRSQFLQAYAQLRQDPKYTDENGSLQPGVWSTLVSKVQQRHGHGGAGAISEIQDPTQGTDTGDDLATIGSGLVSSGAHTMARVAAMPGENLADETTTPGSPQSNLIKGVSGIGGMVLAGPAGASAGIADMIGSAVEGNASQQIQDIGHTIASIKDPNADWGTRVAGAVNIGLLALGAVHGIKSLKGVPVETVVDSVAKSQGPEAAQAVGDVLSKAKPEEVQDAINGTWRKPQTQEPTPQATDVTPQVSEPTPQVSQPPAPETGVKEPWQPDPAYKSYIDTEDSADINRGGIHSDQRISDFNKNLRESPDRLNPNVYVPGKSAWEVTRKEWVGLQPKPYQERAALGHESGVASAVRAGKPVPPEVLADYPDLQKGTTNERLQPEPQSTQPGSTQSVPVENENVQPATTEETGQPGPENRVPEEAQKTTVLTHAGTDELRKQIPELSAYEKQGTTLDAIVKDAQSGGHVDNAVNLAKKTLESPRPWTAPEQVGALIKAHQLRVQADQIQTDLANAIESGDVDKAAQLSVDHNQATGDLDSILLGSDKAGSEWGKSGRVRQMLANGPIDSTNVRDRAVVAKKAPLTPEENATVNELQKRLAESEAAHEAAKSDVEGLKAKLQDALKNRQTNSRLSPRVQSLQPKYNEAVARLQKGIPTGKSTGASINVPQHIVDLGTVLHYNIVKGVRDYGALFQAAKDVAGEIPETDFQQALKLAWEQYKGAPIETRAEAEARVQKQRAANEASGFVNKLESERKFNEKTLAGKVFEGIKYVVGQSKNLSYSLAPLHYAGRHALFVIGRPGLIAKSLGASLKATFGDSVKAADYINTSPFRDIAEAAGLRSDPHSRGGEGFLDTKVGDILGGSKTGKFLQKVSPVQRASHGFGVGLGSLRQLYFDQIAGAFGDKLDLPTAKRIADYVNTATGAGGLGKMEKHAQTANFLLSSVRLLSSRAQILSGTALAKGLKGGVDPLGKAALRDYASAAVATYLVTQLGNVNWHPEDKDSGTTQISPKMKVDVTGGNWSLVKTGKKIFDHVSGRQASSKDSNAWKDLTNFFYWHASPIVTSTVNSFTGERPFEGPTNPVQEAGRAFTPLAVQAGIEGHKAGLGVADTLKEQGLEQIGAFPRMPEKPKPKKSSSKFLLKPKSTLR